MNSNKRIYLRQNVKLEPLFNQWYAWVYLVSPHTAAMYIANLHLKIMHSFIAAPQVHVSALKNPAMIGGPFMHYDASRVSDVKALVDKTIKEQAHMLQLADAIKSLEEMLATEATGFSLEPLYAKIPAALKGYVELVYDLNNHPSIRFIEGLLYRSPYYNESSQSLALSMIESDDRAFVFSTPRLEDPSWLHLKLPFRNQAIDELFKMMHVPQTYGYIKEALGVADEHDDLFSSFFTEDGAMEAPRYDGDSVRIRYYGHACLLIETRDVSILCDPVISYKYENGITRFTYSDLPDRIDYVLLTHNHQDHIMYESLLQLRHKIKNIVVPKNCGLGPSDPSLRLALKHTGFNNVIEIDEMENIEVEGGFITGLPFFGEHGDLNIRSKTAYYVNLLGKSIMCMADSNNIEPKLYEHISDLIGEVDAVFLGMECQGAPFTWLYGPLLTKPLARKMDQTRRFDGSNYDRGIGIIDRFKPKQAYVYAMGQEPWLTHITSIQYTDESYQIVESNKFVTDCKNRGHISERLFGQKEIIL
jgi:L-ascorbate metabolism protein UlaG (beta-lactamase superfamily)